ncbi:hypothetical protein [Bacillus atrophaeus]|uniref:hypothetical protein n=1 Tax=Bacillus atrophaeus TaxID=1452 RepID=UPI002E1C30C6|nr:hypothetical protein [Bacillus atrophaeus]
MISKVTEQEVDERLRDLLLKAEWLANESTGRLFFIRNDGEIVSIGRSRYRENQRIDAGESATLDVHQIFGPNVNARNLINQIAVKDTDSSSPIAGMCINSVSCYYWTERSIHCHRK